MEAAADAVVELADVFCSQLLLLGLRHKNVRECSRGHPKHVLDMGQAFFAKVLATVIVTAASAKVSLTLSDFPAAPMGLSPTTTNTPEDNLAAS